MAGKKDIDIDVSISGLGNAQRSLARLGIAGQRLSVAFGGVGKGINSDFARVGRTISTVSTSITKLGGLAAAISFAGAAGSIGLLVTGLNKASSITLGVAERIDGLEKESKGTMLKGAAEVGGLKYALEQSGAKAEESSKFIATMNEIAMDAVNGDEEARRKLHKIGIHWEDLLDQNGNMRSTIEMIGLMSESFKDLGKDQQKFIGLTELFGKKLGISVANLFDGGGDELRKTIAEYNTLTDIRSGDAAIYADLNDQLNREQKAIEGLGNAFARNYAPAMTAASAARQEFFVSIRPQIDQLSTIMGAYLDELMPRLIKSGEILVELISGSGSNIENSPLKSTFETLISLATGFSRAVLDVLDYLNGEAPAPWIESIIDNAGKAAEFVGGLVDALKALAEIALTAFEQIKPIFALLGIDGDATQIAAIAGLVLFRGTLIGVAGAALSLVSGLGKITGATKAIGVAASASASALGTLIAAGGGVAGVGLLAGAAYTIKSTEDLKREFEKVTEDVKKLADEEGEAFAAAYLRAFIDNVPQEFKGAGFADMIGGAFDSLFGTNFKIDYDGARAEIDVIIDQAKADGAINDVIAGAAAAFKNYGWEIDASGSVHIGAGINISGAELSAAVMSTLSSIDAEINVTNINGLEDILSGAVGNLNALGSDTSRRILPQSYDADPGFSRPNNLAPVTINMPGMEPISGLYGDQDSIDRLAKYANQSRRARS